MKIQIYKKLFFLKRNANGVLEEILLLVRNVLIDKGKTYLK